MKRYVVALCLLVAPLTCFAINAKDIIRKALDKYRGETSYSEITIIIHREDWERTMTVKAWTKGLNKSLVRILSPRKDKGSGNLLIDKNMWSYTPKINRIIKIPSSMSNQSWMGSDFSNNDISRADDIIDEYDHKLLKESKENGHEVYLIESIPHDDAPVVWGKEVSKIRDDYVELEHRYYDQDGKLIKKLTTLDIKNFDGRVVPSVQRMQKEDAKNEWTEVRVDRADYGVKLPARLFTLSSLRNPRM